MHVEALLHRQSSSFAYPIARGMLRIRLRAGRGDLTSCVLLARSRYQGDAPGCLRAPLACYARDRHFDYFQTVIETAGPASYLKYYFELVGGERLFLGARGASREPPERHSFEFLYANEGDIAPVPTWTADRVFYQVLPDRFANGDPTNDPSGTDSWDAPPTRENFYGGDLRGVLDRLPYLTALGANALYLNPVFLSPSNHKYDTTDYRAVDPTLGTTTDLEHLVEECHRRDIRVILDGVFNHCGYHFAPFQDLLRNGAESPYRDWFFVEGFPVHTDPPNYECVGHYRWMPKLRTACPEVREFLLEVACSWMRKLEIDGWRLDVADELEASFLRELRERVKRVNPDCLLIGEAWGVAPDLLNGDRLDSLMNYPLADLAADFFAADAIDASAFDDGLGSLLAAYPWERASILYNLLGSHDTPRFLTRCGGDTTRLKLAVGFQMTFPGMPAVYYGDEVAMSGDNDPGCRAAMAWGRQDLEVLAWHRSLIALRRSRPSLHRGDFCSVVCDDSRGLYGYLRRWGAESTSVLINNSDWRREVELPVADGGTCSCYRDLLSRQELRRWALSPDEASRFHNGDLVPYDGILRVSMAPRSFRAVAGVSGSSP